MKFVRIIDGPKATERVRSSINFNCSLTILIAGDEYVFPRIALVAISHSEQFVEARITAVDFLLRTASLITLSVCEALAMLACAIVHAAFVINLRCCVCCRLELDREGKG